MRKKWWIVALLLSTAAGGSGCASNNTGSTTGGAPDGPISASDEKSPRRQSIVTPPADNTTIARVGASVITRDQLIKPLLEAHGLPLLLNLVQLEMAKQEAKVAGVTLSPTDAPAEQDRTLDRMFRDQKAEKTEYAALLNQFLERRNMSRVEWNLLMEINATLRKVCEAKARGAIKDEQLSTAFMQLYGEKVQVRHIQVSNLQEIAEARRRLAAGETFESIARAMSRNSLTSPLGGEVRPFTMQSPYPQSFKDAAFVLKNKNEVSSPVQADNAYHLIQLMDRIAPKVIKFEDVKASIREDLEERLVQQMTQDLRAQLSDQATRSLVILEPTLKARYELENQRREEQIRGREEVRKELDRQRETAATQQAIPDLPPAPSDQPASQPATTRP